MANILIVGIGAVGGYFGGLLSKTFQGSAQTSVCFMTRGQNLLTLTSEGLRIKSPQGQFTTVPSIVSDDPSDFGLSDYIILCTKSYDLEETLLQLRPTVGEKTVFLPLLNGVNNKERIEHIFPNNLVAEGCANIISRLVAPGVIERFSHFQTIHFGLQGREDRRVNKLASLLEEAQIDARLTDNIWKAIWEKFIFISAVATATSFYDKNFGQLKADPNCLSDLEQLIDEVCLLAEAKRIRLTDNIKEKALQLFNSAPEDSTASMHSDFRSNKGKTEVESLTGYVVKEGLKYGLHLVNYPKMYSYLSDPKLKHAYIGYAYP